MILHIFILSFSTIVRAESFQNKYNQMVTTTTIYTLGHEENVYNESQEAG